MKPASSQTQSATRSAFDASTLLPTISAGLVAGIITVVVEISFAAMIYSGAFAQYLPHGIGFMLFGAIIISAITALRSSFPTAVALPQDAPAAIGAVISGSIAAQVAVNAGQQAIPTLVATIIIATMFTGFGLYLLGRLHMGNLVRYIPFPVLGGFLAGTGYFLVQGGFSAMAGENMTLARIPALLQPDMLIRWLPGVIFAIALLMLLRRRSNTLIIPSMLAESTILFYLVMFLTHTSIDQAHSMNLLLGPFSEGGLWQPPDFGNIGQVDWHIVIGQAGNIFTMLLISVLTLLLNLSGLEVATRQDIDLNRELRLSGWGNVVAGFFGSGPGFTSVALAAIGPKFGSRSRLVGLIVTAMCIFVLFFGTALLNYIPKLILGGMLVFFGLSFMVEWLYDAWARLSKWDYLMIVIIVLVMASVGVLEGIAIGLLFAVGLFIADYSRINVVKHTFSGEYFRSNVERSRAEVETLARRGRLIHILELQGYLFFGTANRLLEEVRQRLSQKDTEPPRFIILDFRRVPDIDVSAVMSFQKMRQLAANASAELIFTTLPDSIQQELEREFKTAPHLGEWHVFPDLDHGVEWCEEQLLQMEEGQPTKPRIPSEDFGSLILRSATASFLENLMGEILPLDKPRSVLEHLVKHFERQEVEKDHVLVQEGQPTKGLYFIEKGQISITQNADGKAIRLRTLHAGTIIGEVSMYTNAIASASAVATVPSVLHFMSFESLHKMEQEEPDAALVLHKFLGGLLSERLNHANKAFEAALE